MLLHRSKHLLRLGFALGFGLGLFCGNVSAQACGYSYAKFFVTDAAGAAVQNADFEFLEKNSNQIAIHSPKALRWSEEESHYFLSEGMCGGHRDVRVKINASGFEAIERVIDLPLTNAKHPLLYRIRLKKKESGQTSSFEYLSALTGRIFDAAGAVVVKAKVTAINSSGKKFETFSNENGQYEIVLPFNKYDSSRNFKEAVYDISAESPGFATTAIKGYVFIPSQFGKMQLDIALVVGLINDENHP